MRRRIVYPNALAQDADLLGTNKNVMVALGMALQSILGTQTLVDGLACTPAVPANLTVNIGSGSIMSLGAVDASAYGSLAADTNQIVKQGIVLGTTSLSCPAPSGAGTSVIYLIQAAFAEVDAGSQVLPYYNASNPSQPYSGPPVNGISSGNAQFTERQGQCVLQVKAGVAAASPVAPTPDPGYVGLYYVTVANGATAITSGNIAAYSPSSLIGTKLTGMTPLLTTARRVGIQFFNANGTYTPSPGLLGGLYFLFGGGGGGGGCYVSTSNTGSVGAGGGGGGLAFGVLTAAQIGTSQPLTIGAAGTGGPVNGSGGTGGTSSLGTLMTATGGSGGSFIPATTGNGIPGGLGGSGTGGSGVLSTHGPSGGSAFTIYGGSGGFFSLSGKGADTLFGTGGAAVTAGSPSSVPGNVGTGFGAGGSGAASTGGGAGNGGGAGSVGGFVAIEFCTQ